MLLKMAEEGSGLLLGGNGADVSQG